MTENTNKRAPTRPIEEELPLAEVKSYAVSGATSLLTRQLFIRGLGFLGMLVLARLLSPEVFGVFAVASFLITLLESLSTLGLNAALIRRREPVSEIDLSTVFTAQLAFAVTAAGLIWMLAPAIAGHYELDADGLLLIRVMALVLLLNLFKTIPDVLLQRRMRFDLLALAQSLEYVAYLAVAIGLAAAGFEVWALALAAIGRSVVSVALLGWFARWRPAPAWDFDVLRGLFGFAMPIQLSTIVSMAQNAAVPVVVGSLFGVAAVGVVNLGRTLLDSAIRQPLMMLGRVQLRVYGRVQDEEPKLTRAVETGLFASAALAFLPAALFLALGDSVIGVLLGAKWLGAVPTVQTLGIAFAAYAWLLPATSALKALGHSWAVLTTNLIIAAGVLLGTWLLAGTVQELGFSIAMLVAVPVAAGFAVQRCKRLFPLQVLPRILPALVAAGAATALAMVIDGSVGGLSGLVLGVTAAGLAYALVLSLAGGEELARLLRSVQAAKRNGGRSARLDRLADLLAAVDLRAILLPDSARGRQ